MIKIALNKEKIYCGNLLLVNSDYPLKNNSVNELIPADTGFASILIQTEAAKNLHTIMKKISSKRKIVPVSGYRSEVEQREIYTDSLRENGEVFTKKYVAPPNCSEHQTGLAIDLALNKANIDFICPDFPYEGICNDFRKAAPNYGFIQRYSENKEKITGISHEPWHFRYVGFPHSKIIDENNFSLEEYIKFIKDFTHENKFIYTCKDGKVIEIFYVKFNRSNSKIILPDDCYYRISGNNFDGFIITQWRK